MWTEGQTLNEWKWCSASQTASYPVRSMISMRSSARPKTVSIGTRRSGQLKNWRTAAFMLSAPLNGSVGARVKRYPAMGLEFEHSGRVQTENLGADIFTEISHLAFDCGRRMRPRALVMRIVISPHEVTGQAVLAGQIETDRILLEGRKAVRAEIVTWQL